MAHANPGLIGAAVAPELRAPSARARALLDGWSLEMTAKDTTALEAAAPLIPAGTKIPVAFMPNETHAARIAAARRLRELGFVPIPHLAARRFASEAELEGLLAALRDEAAIDHAFVVAGDLDQPLGPFPDALSLIRSGLLARHGVRRVGISGYPEGHPDIADQRLWEALLEKRLALTERGHDFAVVTQFGFDAEPVLAWLARVRAAGFDDLVRIGVPGPASVATLMRFAARCGVGTSARVLSKYGLSMTRLVGAAGPERLIEALAGGVDPSVHGAVKLHFFPFGGLSRTAEWVRDFRGPASADRA